MKLIIKENINLAFSSIAAVFGVLAFVVALLAWRFPQEIPPFKMDRDLIYDNEKSIGHTTEYRIDPILMGQFAMRLDETDKLEVGEIIGFHDSHCALIAIAGEAKIQMDENKIRFSYDHVDCRIIGK